VTFQAPTPVRRVVLHPLYVLLADVVLVLIFAATGRASHAEEHPVLGVLLTAWPFLTGLLIGWLASRNWRTPLRLWPNGVLLWIITVLAGMLLRIVSGRTAELPFIMVATVVLGLFLLGFRVIAGRLVALRQRGAR
jgi:peptidoglycan/LPS O-acetylase OafA/YrhL